MIINKSFFSHKFAKSIYLSSKLYPPLFYPPSCQLQLIVPMFLWLHRNQGVFFKLPSIQGNYPDGVVGEQLDVVDFQSNTGRVSNLYNCLYFGNWLFVITFYDFIFLEHIRILRDI